MIDEIVREGANRMPTAVSEAEVNQSLVRSDARFKNSVLVEREGAAA
ncbi:hypothetical protein [Streptomyces sp. NPDC058457]